MRILVLGADGYLGWPTCLHLSARGHNVLGVDNFAKRQWVAEVGASPLYPTQPFTKRAEVWRDVCAREVEGSLSTRVGDCTDHEFLRELMATYAPDAVVHYAEQPSGPWSMMGYDQAKRTLNNNVGSTLALIWAVIRERPQCHIIKLGTMGEYGTPNIPIEEGWLNLEHEGRKDRLLFPREAGSFYHTTKILDTDMLWFYVRNHQLSVTDLMQGPVYGLSTPETKLHPELGTCFHYDAVFGTVLNRFCVQALAGHPLTVYGKGGQTRGYLNLLDTLRCVELAITKGAARGELRIMNQFTEQFSVNELAERVASAATKMKLDPQITHLANRRIEKEEHFYEAKHTKLVELGLEPTLLTEEVLLELLETLRERMQTNGTRVDPDLFIPRVRWGSGFSSDLPSCHRS